jgi:hypothetical protein
VISDRWDRKKRQEEVTSYQWERKKGLGGRDQWRKGKVTGDR